jgi:hypothetical protein
MPAHLKTLTVFFIACFLLSACSPASPASVIPTGTPVELNIPSSTPSPIPTALPTETPISATPTYDAMEEAAIPTAEVNLVGLIAEVGNIPLLTPQEVQAHLQKIKDTVRVAAPTDPINRIQIGLYPNVPTDKSRGKFIRVGANYGSERSFKIADTYMTTFDSDSGPVRATVVVFVIWAKYQSDAGDVLEGQIVLPVVCNGVFPPESIGLSGVNDEQFLLNKISRLNEGGKADFFFLVSLDHNSVRSDNPVTNALYEMMQKDQKAQALLEKAYKLAKKGSSLHQADIDYLAEQGFIIYWF